MLDIFSRRKKNNGLEIQAFWDENAKLWIITSDDILGLAIEALTPSELSEKLKFIVPELLYANHLVTQKSSPEVLVTLIYYQEKFKLRVN